MSPGVHAFCVSSFFRARDFLPGYSVLLMETKKLTCTGVGPVISSASANLRAFFLEHWARHVLQFGISELHQNSLVYILKVSQSQQFPRRSKLRLPVRLDSLVSVLQNRHNGRWGNAMLSADVSLHFSLRQLPAICPICPSARTAFASSWRCH